MLRKNGIRCRLIDYDAPPIQISYTPGDCERKAQTADIATHAGAAAYTIDEMFKAHGLNAEKYLNFLPERGPISVCQMRRWRNWSRGAT